MLPTTSTTLPTAPMRGSKHSPAAPTRGSTQPARGSTQPMMGSMQGASAAHSAMQERSGTSIPPMSMLPIMLPAFAIIPPALESDAPTSPKPPAIAPITITPAAPPTAYLATETAPPLAFWFFIAVSFLSEISNAHSLVCAHGTPCFSDRSITCCSRCFSCVSQALAVIMSMRCLTNTLSNGIESALFCRSSATGMLRCHTAPPATRPWISIVAGRPPTHLPLIITGAPAKRSGTGKGRISTPCALCGIPTAMLVRMGVLDARSKSNIFFSTVSGEYAAPFMPRPMPASILRK
mmetsp:Transcript_6176/g.26240  ORF Transcript_6176/g.26240 Transcript_6176/m.26240 type:complete len:293 (+) Transcript_6176:1326-2204(+)